MFAEEFKIDNTNRPDTLIKLSRVENDMLETVKWVDRYN